MADLARTSRAFGFAGTAILHLCVIQACVFTARRPIAKPTPRLEPLRINLAEPAAPAFRLPKPAPAPDAPKPKPPEPEPKPPEPAPLVQTASEPQESAVALPQEAARFAEPPAGPPATAGHYQGSGPKALTKEEIEHALIASLEREKRYPAAARRLGVEGLVMAQVQLDAQGRIVGAGVRGTGSDPMLERATTEALQRVQKKWAPTPPPGPMTLNIPVRYSLER